MGSAGISILTDERMADDDRVLFCPFCRESYEGKTQCPEHELALVEFAALPKQSHERQLPGWDEPIPLTDLRFGRAWMVAGCALAVIGFFLELAGGTIDTQQVSFSGFEAATGRAPNLWTVPFAAAMYVAFLYRRKTPAQMRGARLAGTLLAIMPFVSVIYSAWNVQRGAEAAHGAVELSWGIGCYMMAASSVLFAIGALRFGAMPGGYSTPHGSEPEEEPALIEPDADDAPKRPRRRRRR
jgi:hypothetical protein